MSDSEEVPGAKRVVRAQLMPSPDDPSKTLLRPKVVKIRAGRWTAGELRRFERGLAKYGPGRWALVSEKIGTRTTEQTRSHAKKHFARLKREGLMD